MKRLHNFLILSFLFSISLIFASEMQLSIRYLGLPVVRVKITDNGNELKVHAKATTIASIAAKMDNTYISEYTDDYLSSSYRKIIKQKDYAEDRIINYDRINMIAKRKSYINENITKDYPINGMSRDFFSALFYLRGKLNESKGDLWLDANSLIWKAPYEIVKKEIIRTTLGKVETIKVKIDFENVNELEKERSDMLTNNLVNDEKSLYFWFTADEQHIPVKAKFEMKPFPVIWKLDSYKD
ncbi:MAG: hypothetical protein DRI23_03775 [Candidatus Cloacimonadota bacterium]|nr:MAG: hypothetical protein DRI23_03775 [Candidatus Cloacimonadota bacterium]